jgi:multiple sugar transport system ATP-binding protein
VFQQYSLYPHLSVFDNLAFPLRSPMRPMSEPKVREKVMEVARLLRIDDKLANSATKLSGGQMQRVAIGRALVRDPAVTLMDEPLSSLDAKLRNDLRLELKRIQQDLGATMLYVTHDQTEALTLASRIGVLDHGHLVQMGSPRDIYENPQSSTVAARLGAPRINLVPRAALGDWPAPGSAASAGVRAEHLHVHATAADSPQSGAAVLRARVKRIEILSDQRLVHLALADGEHELVSVAPGAAALEPGAQVHVELRRVLWFDAQGQRVAG